MSALVIFESFFNSHKIIFRNHAPPPAHYNNSPCYIIIMARGKSLLARCSSLVTREIHLFAGKSKMKSYFLEKGDKVERGEVRHMRGGEGIRDDGVTAEVTEAWLLVRSVLGLLGAIIIVIIQIIIRVRSQHSQQCLPVCSVTRLTQAARHSSSQYSPDWPRLLYPRLRQLTVSNTQHSLFSPNSVSVPRPPALTRQGHLIQTQQSNTHTLSTSNCNCRIFVIL